MNELTGKRVLITRPLAQADGLVEMLASLGAVPVLFPTIEIAPLDDTSQIDQAIASLNRYQWVIFTSANGVDAFWQRLRSLGRAFEGVRAAAIGPSTALALQARGVSPDFVPAEYVAEAIVPGLGDVHGQRILLPRADIARKALVEALVQRGALPDELAVYRTVIARPTPAALAELEKGIDAATFTSASTVKYFFEILGGRAQEILRGAVIACIGPITANAARSQGLTVHLVAAEYTVDGLVAALTGYFMQETTRKSHESAS